MKTSPEEAAAVLASAERLFDQPALDAVLMRMSQDIGLRLAGTNPLLLCMMVGGIATTAKIAEQLPFPLEIDYLHVTRYRGQTQGGEVHWLHPPSALLQGRQVLIIDDILDEGYTLLAARTACLKAGATDVLSAVLVEKLHDRRAIGARADFAGVQVDDRYVFGFGMDYKGYWRNLPAIYAVA